MRAKPNLGLFAMKVLTFSAQILTLHFVVLSFDRYSRDDVVGEVRNDRDNN